MSVAQTAPRVSRPPTGLSNALSPTRWAIWDRSTSAVSYILIVDTLAVLIVATELVRVPIEPSMLAPFMLLVACSVAYIETSRPIEQVREHQSSTPHIDLNSVWMFAGVLLLHPSLAAGIIATSYTYRWLRVRPHVVHRQVFSSAATILACYAAAWLLTHLAGSTFGDAPRTTSTFVAVALAGVTFVLVNSILIAFAIALTIDNPRFGTVLGRPADYGLELSTVALGVLLAWTLVDWPVAMTLIVGVTLVLHRNVLIRQLHEKATTDAKTGLLNAATWTSVADSELDWAARHNKPTGLLVIDLDHFKAINDEYGHLAGDEMLRAVADTITSEVRTYDPVGRFGGEEFVVLLPATSATETVHVAERIRRRIAELTVPISARLTVSIGVAAFPDDGSTRREVLHAADMAMYRAKAAGRNRVRQAWEARCPQ